MRKTPLAAFAALALATPLAALGSPAFAGTANAPVTLRYDDLDLGSAAGKRELDSRIRTAARSFCRNAESTGTNLARDVCLRQIRAEVLAGIDSKERSRKGG